MNLQERRERIESFGVGELQEENWDSYGARPVDKRAINVALKVSEAFGDDDWFPSPCPDGDILFEKDTDYGAIMIGVTIYDSERFEARCAREKKERKE